MSADPIHFIEQLVNHKTGERFVLTKAEKRFLRRAFTLTPSGRLKFPELIYSAPKKTGKTTFAAMIVLYVVCVLGGKFAEAIVCANDAEQATSRVFEAIKQIVKKTPLLAPDATITQSKITFESTGSTIIAIASDAASAAGADPTITVFDELWGYTSERLHRLWDEMVPPPTRKIACRLVVTYAGFEGESTLLESLHARGLKGEQVKADLYAQPGMLCYWTHKLTAPWQDSEWLEQMRATMRPTAFLRQIENRWVSTDSSFIDMAQWDACVDPSVTALLSDTALSVWVGVDASFKHDSTAIVVCTYDYASKKVRLLWHRVFQPSPDDPLDFENTIEKSLLELRRRFRVREVRYDPHMLQAVAQRLVKSGLPMLEFAQSVPNLTEASQNLFELINAHNLVVYPDKAMRLAVQRSIAIETTRGWRIAKEKTSHKIDVVVALGMAALGALDGIAKPPVHVSEQLLEWARRPTAYSRAHARTHLMGTRVAGGTCASGTYASGKIKAFF